MGQESGEISLSTINKCNGKECPKINYLHDANQKLFIGVGPEGQSVLRQIALNCALFENKEPSFVRFGDINDIANIVNNNYIVFIACSASYSQLEAVRQIASTSSFVMTFIYDNLICRQTIEPNNNECIIPVSNSDIIGDMISNIYLSLCEPQFICRDIKDLRKAHGGKIGKYIILNGSNINHCLEQYKEMNHQHTIFNKIQTLSIFYGFNNTKFDMDEILYFTKSVVQNIPNDVEIMFNIAVSNHIINSSIITLVAS